jgi:hypothetical protein
MRKIKVVIAPIHATAVRLSDPRCRNSSMPSFPALVEGRPQAVSYRHEDHCQAGADAGARPPIGVNVDGLNTSSLKPTLLIMSSG